MVCADAEIQKLVRYRQPCVHHVYEQSGVMIFRARLTETCMSTQKRPRTQAALSSFSLGRTHRRGRIQRSYMLARAHSQALQVVAAEELCRCHWNLEDHPRIPNVDTGLTISQLDIVLQCAFVIELHTAYESRVQVIS